MNRLLKTLLIWLVIASLPIRGLAADNASCARALQMPVHGDAVHSPHQSAATDMPAHCDLAELTTHAFGHDAGGEESSYKHHPKSAGCSGQICYIGAAAPPLSLVWTDPHDSSELIDIHPAVSFNGHIPSGLERPPRHFLG